MYEKKNMKKSIIYYYREMSNTLHREQNTDLLKFIAL